jgi:hypothetical protein
MTDKRIQNDKKNDSHYSRRCGRTAKELLQEKLLATYSVKGSLAVVSPTRIKPKADTCN